MKPLSLLTFLLALVLTQNLLSQEKFIDINTRNLLDSLDKRAEELNRSIRGYGANRDAKFFYNKRELDMTVFLREYEELVFDENLAQAQRLIDSRIKVSQKRADMSAVEYYTDYKTKVTKLRGQKMGHYQQLFAKEKSFKKELDTYLEPADKYAYIRTLRMLDLAIKYAEEKGLTETLGYLNRYWKYTHALILDLENDFDLKKLTSSEGQFHKEFEPLINADSLKNIQRGQEMVKSCLDFSALSNSKLDTNYFLMQEIVAANAIADWNERQGISSVLASLTGQSIVARRDSINREGIYQWNDLILVIGSVNFDSKSKTVRKGEAIIDADRTLISYLRVNKLTKSTKNMELGKTYLLPVKDRDKVSYFRYDQKRAAWQYIVAYTHVISPKFTEKMGRFLPPLQFQDGISSTVQ